MPTAAVKTQVCANKIGTLPGAFGGAWVVAGASGYLPLWLPPVERRSHYAPGGGQGGGNP